jgi:hypothetical protein
MKYDGECGAVSGISGGEAEELGENMPQCCVAYHKSHMTDLDCHIGKPETNHLSYGAA